MKRLLVGVIAIITVHTTNAQTVLENNPPRIRWNQINTEDFRILFPRGFDNEAQRMANTLQHIHEAEARTLGKLPRKISVILQNQSAISNGFVSALPRRSEFFTMPSQNYNFLGNTDWLDMLASHEYRHIVQYQHAMRGANKALYYLFGANTFALMSQIAVPRWFWEGDAVATETAYTATGRGRIPNFALAFRTNLIEGRVFNYDKQFLRSYKHFVPDHYVFGYHMVSYLRQRTQRPDVWSDITRRAWNVPFMPLVFSTAVKKESGMGLNKLYKQMAVDLQKEWQAEINKLELTPFETMTTFKRHGYTDYLYPQILDDGSVVAMRRGIGEIEKLVRVSGANSNKKLFTLGLNNETGMISSAKDIVLWNEHSYHGRWNMRSFSMIKAYDISEKKVRVIGGRKQRYAGSALSPDAKQIATIRSDHNYKVSVVILDYESGKVIKEFANDNNAFFSMPRWTRDGQKIVLLKIVNNKKTVSILDVASGTASDLIPPTEENIGYPVLTEQYLLFNSPVSGIDNIYAIEIQSGQRYQVTSSKYGAYNPALTSDGKTLYYNEQGRDGMEVVRTSFEPTRWKKHQAQVVDNAMVANLVHQEHHPGLFDSVPDIKHPVKRYSRLKGLINPYSWGFFTDNNLAQAEFGISSRDLLSTATINLGVAYDINERTWSRKAGVSYQGWLPIIDFNYLAGDRNVTDTYFGNSVKSSWKETTFEAGLRLPVTLTRSKYLRQLTIGNYVGVTQTRSFVNEVTVNDEDDPLEFPNRLVPAFDSLFYIDKTMLSNGDLVYNRFSLSFYNLIKRSYRDFLHRWGQTVDFEWYGTPFGGDFRGDLAVIRGTAYFPGLFRHHFLYTRVGYQKLFQSSDQDLYQFRNRLFKPRGHAFPSDEKFVSFSANYALPVWYPDIAVGALLNVQRFKLNMFYDFGQGSGRQYYYSSKFIYYSTSDATYHSLGGELTMDFNVLRFPFQFEVGVRASYIPVSNIYNNKGTVIEFMIGNLGF